jgi:hypothetical protein
MGEGDNANATSNKYVKLWIRSLRVDIVGTQLNIEKIIKELRNAKMYSIRQKLSLELIFALIVIALFFILYMIVLYSLGFSLTPEAYAQIISAMATTLVVVLTLGLRLVDDALNRYDKFTRPIIETLLKSLDSIKTALSLPIMNSLPIYSQELVRSSSALGKHGQFFLTKLYPQKSLNKIDNVLKEIDKFLKTLEEFKPIWSDSEYMKTLFDNIEFQKEISNDTPEVRKRKSESIRHAKELRETMLKEIDDIIKGLDDFLEAN